MWASSAAATGWRRRARSSPSGAATSWTRCSTPRPWATPPRPAGSCRTCLRLFRSSRPRPTPAPSRAAPTTASTTPPATTLTGGCTSSGAAPWRRRSRSRSSTGERFACRGVSPSEKSSQRAVFSASGVRGGQVAERLVQEQREADFQRPVALEQVEWHDHIRASLLVVQDDQGDRGPCGRGATLDQHLGVGGGDESNSLGDE